MNNLFLFLLILGQIIAGVVVPIVARYYYNKSKDKVFDSDKYNDFGTEKISNDGKLPKGYEIPKTEKVE